jgi:hypothetical protein
MRSRTTSEGIIALIVPKVHALFEEVPDRPRTIWEIETLVIALVRELGLLLMSALAGTRDGFKGKTIRGHRDVGDGSHLLEFKDMVDRTVTSWFGKFTYRRAYYHSTQPKDSRWPRDEELGLGPEDIWTPVLQKLVLWFSTVTGSYGKATEAILRTLGFSLEYKQAQRAAVKIGQQEQQREAKQMNQVFELKQRLPDFQRTPAACMIVSADGIELGLHTGGFGEVKVGAVFEAALQAPKSSPQASPEPSTGAEELAPTERQTELAALKDSKETKEYKASTKLVEEALAVVAPDRKSQPSWKRVSEHTTYRATRAKCEEFGRMLWMAAQMMGVEVAKMVIFLADGGPWCWNLCQTHFPQAIQILDVFHLARNVYKASAIFFGDRSAKAHEWAKQLLIELLQGHLESVLAELNTLTFTSQKMRDERRRLIGYLRANRDRMDYPTYIANGYPIGSGVIEGACRHVIGQRMKGSGRRWNDAGAEAMARLRAIECSHRWDRFWEERQRLQTGRSHEALKAA